MRNIRVLGINVSNRDQVAVKVQNILTYYGCSIRTRLGLSDDDETTHGTGGLIILELTGDVSEWDKLENELLELDYVEVNKMDFKKDIR